MSSKQTILIAEDDAPTRELLAEELEASYDVLLAQDGKDTQDD